VDGKQPIPAPGPLRQTPLGILLARVGKQVDRAFDDALVVAGGNRPVWLTLLAIKTGAGRTQSALADRVGVSGPTLIHHLDRMEEAGLVTRNREPTNRRVQVVALTPAGHEAFLRLRSAAVEFDHRLHEGLTDREVTDLRHVLGRIAKNVGTEPTTEKGESS
jgi:MarR family transcriptional regulator, transcriptional regulator for hemolysin